MLHLIEPDFDVPNPEVLRTVVDAVPHFQALANMDIGFGAIAEGHTGSILPRVRLYKGDNPVFKIRIGSIQQGAAFGLAKMQSGRYEEANSLLPDGSGRLQLDSLFPFMIPDVFRKTESSQHSNVLSGVELVLLSALPGKVHKKQNMKMSELVRAVLRGKTEDPTSAFEEMKAHIAQNA